MEANDKLFARTGDLVAFCVALLVIFFLNLSLEWKEYSKVVEFPYCKTISEVKSVNTRIKNGAPYSSVEFESVDGYRFYSAKNINMGAIDSKIVEVTFDSSKLSFFDFLRGFRTRSFDVAVMGVKDDAQSVFKTFIANRHNDERLKKLFVSLFFETRLPDFLQQKINEFGLSAVMSLSGLNLSLLVGLIFLVITPPYRYIQDIYFPYRNRNFDILLFALVVMIFYAYLAGFAKPFMRALIMALTAFILSLRGIKIINFTTLAVTLAIMIAFSPRSLFSIGLWLSVIGVYYIFIFLRQTNFSKVWQSYLFLGVFVFLAMSVIARFLFPLFSLAQLSSPITSVLFDFFYPIEVVLHIFGFGYLFDKLLTRGLDIDVSSLSIPTPELFFYIFLLLSVLSYFRKEAFWLLCFSSATFTAISVFVAF